MSREEFLWTQKHRPRTVAETILPEGLKRPFQEFVDQKNIPNMILSGSAGIGKTTIAKAMLDEIGADYITINGSMSGNIDTLRNEIRNFASTVSFTGGRKYVILDEADYLNPNSTQPALRNFMEEYSRNCGFILTCNFKNRIIEPLHSRCTVIDFRIDRKDSAKMAMAFMKRVCEILAAEGVEFEKPAVAEFITKHYPDWRRVINELQRYAATGRIDTGILANVAETSIKELIGLMKAKDFTKVRKWLGENSDIEDTVLFRKFYEECDRLMMPSSIPQLILILAEYQYKAAFVVDHELNLAACMGQVMAECAWKD